MRAEQSVGPANNKRVTRSLTSVKQIPNLITALRFLLVPLLVWALREGRYQDALLLCAVMAMSDGLDGYLAKRFGWRTSLGAYLDPLADKVMLVSAFITLGWMQLVPAWLVAIIVLRDAVILIGAGSYHLLTRRLEMNPSTISKLNTVVQIVLVLAVIIDQLVNLPAELVQFLMGLTLLTTLTSGLKYAVDWGRKAIRR